MIGGRQAQAGEVGQAEVEELGPSCAVKVAVSPAAR